MGLTMTDCCHLKSKTLTRTTTYIFSRSPESKWWEASLVRSEELGRQIRGSHQQFISRRHPVWIHLWRVQERLSKSTYETSLTVFRAKWRTSSLRTSKQTRRSNPLRRDLTKLKSIDHRTDRWLMQSKCFSCRWSNWQNNWSPVKIVNPRVENSKSLERQFAKEMMNTKRTDSSVRMKTLHSRKPNPRWQPTQNLSQLVKSSLIKVTMRHHQKWTSSMMNSSLARSKIVRFRVPSMTTRLRLNYLKWYKFLTLINLETYWM